MRAFTNASQRFLIAPLQRRPKRVLGLIALVQGFAIVEASGRIQSRPSATIARKRPSGDIRASPAPPRCSSARRKLRNVLMHRLASNPHQCSFSLDLDGRVPDRRLRLIREHLHTVCPCQQAQGVGLPLADSIREWTKNPRRPSLDPARSPRALPNSNLRKTTGYEGEDPGRLHLTGDGFAKTPEGDGLRVRGLSAKPFPGKCALCKRPPAFQKCPDHSLPSHRELQGTLTLLSPVPKP
jgi:hypothetical protein